MYKVRFLISYFLIIVLLTKVYPNKLRSNGNQKIIEIISHNISNNYKSLNLFSCNRKSCIQGKCLNKNLCTCNEGYYVVQKHKGCTYSNKSKYISAFLEVLFPGLGHIYSLRFLFGIFKILIGLIMIKLLRYIITKKKSYSDLFLKIFFTINIITIHLYDISRFLLNNYTDGYGIPLESNDINLFFMLN